MIVCPRSLLLGLLAILYLQSCAVGNNAKAPEECCFNFFNSPIPVAFINDYEETGADCPKAGVIFTDLKGRRLCADPGFRWVKRAMGMVDRRIVENLNSTEPSS
uniref:C-C motif chemokine n=1 Tax=Pygocentrus nattereri TaxID=42514 RepID=A0A3B4CLK3_PYGNA